MIQDTVESGGPPEDPPPDPPPNTHTVCTGNVYVFYYCNFEHYCPLSTAFNIIIILAIINSQMYYY